MHTYASALFPDRHSAHAAVEQLVQAGFPRDAIGIAMSEGTHEREFGTASQDRPAGIGRCARPSMRIVSSAGVLAAIVAGLAAVRAPNDEALRVGGPPLEANTRDGSWSAVLAPLGLGEVEAQAAEAGLHEGAILIGVQAAAERLRLARQLLELSGGVALETGARNAPEGDYLWSRSRLVAFGNDRSGA